MQSQVPLYIQVLTVEFRARKMSLLYPGTPGGPRMGHSSYFPSGGRSGEGKGTFGIYSKGASARQVPRQREGWEKERSTRRAGPGAGGPRCGPSPAARPRPGLRQRLRGAAGLAPPPPSLPAAGPGPPLPASGPPPAPPAAALGGGSAGPARCWPSRAMAAERGGCALEAVPLPPEVRESLAELELELSEGEWGRLWGGHGWRPCSEAALGPGGAGGGGFAPRCSSGRARAPLLPEPPAGSREPGAGGPAPSPRLHRPPAAPAAGAWWRPRGNSSKRALSDTLERQFYFSFNICS